MSRTAIVVFGVLAVIFGAAALYSMVGAPREATAPAALLGVDASQVRGLRVERTGEAPAIVERTPDGAWRLRREGGGEGAWWPVNPGNARGAVRALTELRPLAEAPPATPINEVLTITAILDDGSTRSLHVDAETLGGRRLVRTGDGRAASVDGAVVDAFTNPGPLGWRQRVAMPGVGTDVARITLSGAGGTLRLARTGASWRIDEPVRARAGDAQVRALLGALAGGAVQRFIDDDALGAEAPAGAEQARLTIVCEIDERAVDDAGEVRTTTRAITLHIGAPAGVDGSAYFARTGAGQALVVDGSLAALSLDPASYAAATAAQTRPQDVGAIVVRDAGGAERGYRRAVSAWERMAPDGSLTGVEAQPIDDLLSFLSQRVAPQVRFDRPADLTPIATVTLLDFASGPLETVGVLRGADGLVCELRPVGASEPVYLVYPSAPAPALLAGVD